MNNFLLVHCPFLMIVLSILLSQPDQPQSVRVECFHSCVQLVVVWSYLVGRITNNMVHWPQRGQAVALCPCRIKISKSKPFLRSSVDIAIIILHHLKRQQEIQLPPPQGGWHVNRSQLLMRFDTVRSWGPRSRLHVKRSGNKKMRTKVLCCT